MIGLWIFWLVASCYSCVRNIVDALTDKYRSIRILSMILAPFWLAMAIMAGIMLAREAMP